MTELNSFTFVATLVVEFKKIECDDETKYNTFYSKSGAKIISNERESFEPIYSTFISLIQKSLGRGSDSIINSIIDHNINIPK